MNKNEKYIILAPSNSHCFNKIAKDWLEDIIKKDQRKVYEKDIRPTLCVNKILEDIKIDRVKNILNCGLHPGNVH